MIEPGRPSRSFGEDESLSEAKAERLASEAVEGARRLGREAAAHARAWRRYLTTRADAARYGLARLALSAAGAILGLVAAVAIVATASVLLLSGIAALVSSLVPGQAWLGPLAAGALGLGLAGGAIVALRRRTARSFAERFRKKYGAPSSDPGERS
jgi:hypothetical protein